MASAYQPRRSRIGRRSLALMIVALAVIAPAAWAPGPTSPAHAEDRVAALTRMLASSSEKTRLSAVLALAKLGEPRVDRPLIRALADPSARVRGVAATALGRLDCVAALPRLRGIARDDADADVRKAASTAAMKITGKNHPVERGAPDGEAWARRPAPGGERPAHTSYAVEPHPDLYVLVNSSADESPGTTDPATRRVHAELVKRVLVDRLRSDAQITSAASEARRWDLGARHVDLSVTRLATSRVGEVVEVDAQLRIAISDESGKLLSFLSGGAKVQVPAGKFDARYLPTMRRDALDGAMRGMLDKLLSQLRQPP